MSLIVAKFGGTSVADFNAMDRCATIIQSNPSTRIVVVSASSGITNMLVELAQPELDEAKRSTLVSQIATVQATILDGLNANQVLYDKVAALLAQLEQHLLQQSTQPQAQWSDELLSFGERFSSLLFAEVLKQRGVEAICFDVRQVMLTDDRHGKATPNHAQLTQHCQSDLRPLCDHHVIVTQGFIGANSQGQTTTLGRGGSDYSAALLAEGVGATELQIWTDVEGIFTTDPRIRSEATAIHEISFSEAAEMATFGAKILHPSTLWPAIRNNTPVFVGSSRNPDAGGTHIKANTDETPMVRAVALRKNQTLVTVHSLNMLHAQGFLANVFTILAKHHISVDLVTTSEVSVALTLDGTGSDSTGRNLLTADVIDELSQICRVEIENELALIAVIGNHLHTHAAISEQTFRTVAPHNVRMICQGASPNNLCFLVAADDAEPIINKLHQHFLEFDSPQA